MHKALKYLASPNDYVNLTHVYCDDTVVRSEFLNQVAFNLLQLGEVEFKIHYKDMREIQYEYQFIDMLLEM
jgi:hypothetical protein